MRIAVPKTEMIGDSSRYVKEGSKVSLHCIVTGALDPPLYIIWYHGVDQLFPDNKRGWRTDINRDNLESNTSHGTVSERFHSLRFLKEFTLFLIISFQNRLEL